MSYVHGHHESVLRSHRWRTVDNSAAHLAPRLGPGLRVLDVGCGPGTITADLAARVAPGRVTGIDASSEIVAQATAEYGEVAEFAVGDVYALDLADDAVDVVHAHQVLQHLEHLDLRRPRVASVVGRAVGRPGPAVGVSHRGDRSGPRHHRRAPGDHRAWRTWAEDPDAVFVCPHGEILARG